MATDTSVSTRSQAPSVATASLPLPLVYAGLWFVVIAWGGSFVAARALLHATTAGQVALSPTVLATVRFGLASLFFVIPLTRAVVRRQVSRGDLLRMVLLGQLTYSVYFWLQYTGVQQTSAGVASILVIGLMPLTTAVIARMLGRERLTWSVSAALLIGAVGVVLVVFQQGIQVERNAGFLFGALCLIGNAIAFAVYSNFSKQWMRTIPPLVMTGGTMMSGALGLLVFSVANPGANDWTRIARLDGGQWLALLYLILVCSIAAYLAYNVALTRIPASSAAAFNYFEPVVAVVFGAVLLSERPSIQAMLGALIIALSIFLLHRARRR